MKYIFWFFIAVCVIASLARNERSNYSYQTTPSSSHGNYTPSYQPPQKYYPPQRQVPVAPKWQVQTEKPVKAKKKSPRKHSDDHYYQSETPSWVNRGGDIDWEKFNRESEKRMQEFMKNSRFNEIDWEKQQREASARIDAIMRQQNATLGNSSRNSLTTTYPQTYSTQTPSSSLWTSPSTSSGSYVSSYSHTPLGNETYTINGTEYYNNETYSTTGKPKVKRSMAVRNQFLRSQGYAKVPDGYEVDHIIPLSQGGSDTPDNMQLLTVEQHRQKTARERANTSSTGLPSSYFSTPTAPSIYSTPSTTLPSSSPVIHTGPRGGQYYINSNGNKTYVKKN